MMIRFGCVLMNVEIKKKKKEAFDNFEIDIDIITCLDSILWWRVAGDWRRTRRQQIPWSSTHPASSTSSAILLMLTPQLNWIESWKNLYICREREGWRRIREWRESICLVHPIILSSFSLPPLPSAAATTSTHVGTTASHKHLHAYRSTTSHSISL